MHVHWQSCALGAAAACALLLCTGARWRPTPALGGLLPAAAGSAAPSGAAGCDRGPAIADLLLQTPEQLAETLMWWRHTVPIERPPGPPLYPAPARTSYITWENIGGLNNARMQLEVIAMLGQLMGRTLVLPDHTSTFFVNMEGNVSLNDFYDIARLAAWVPVISMQEYMDVRGVSEDDPVRVDEMLGRDWLNDSSRHSDVAFPDWNALYDVIAPGSEEQKRPVPGLHPPLHKWRWQDGNADYLRRVVHYGLEERAALTLHFRPHPACEFCLFGSAGFIYHPTLQWRDYHWALVRDFIHIRPDLVRAAATVLARILSVSGGRFSALHLRSTDWAYNNPEKVAPIDVLTAKAVKVLGTEWPLYVATDDVDRVTLAPLIQAFPKVMFLEDFIGELLPDMHVNYYGVVETLLCSMANRFMGTFGSTFSAYINRIRGYHRSCLVPDKGIYFTNWPQNEAEFEDSVVHNARWTASTWWPQPGTPVYDSELCHREFALTWDFHSREVTS